MSAGPRNLQLHHVGCLVANIEDAAAAYVAGGLGTNPQKSIRIASQQVRVAFIETGGGSLVELIEPEAGNESLSRLLRRGINLYHLGYLCHDMPAAGAMLVASGGRELNRFRSEAFSGLECAFFLTAAGQLIELIEAP